MSSSSKESLLRKWIDRALIFDLFLVILGSLLFILGLVLNYFGINLVIDFFQLLWKPFFLPAIIIFISASLLVALIDWLQRKVLGLDLDN